MLTPLVTLSRSTNDTSHTILELQYCGERVPTHSVNNLQRRVERAGWKVEGKARYLIQKRAHELVPCDRFRLGLILGNEYPVTRSTYRDVWATADSFGWHRTEVLVALYLATIPRQELGYETVVIFHPAVQLSGLTSSGKRLPYCLCLTKDGVIAPTRSDPTHRLNPGAAYVFAVPDASSPT